MNLFKKTHRLLKKSDYNHVFAQAKKIATPEFVVLYRNNDKSHARLGLALSKKMIAKSHDRNRIKRLIRETFRTNKQLPCVDIIFLARLGVGNIENSIITGKLGKAWNKLSASYET
jgi:ribonuclease P protein component